MAAQNVRQNRSDVSTWIRVMWMRENIEYVFLQFADTDNAVSSTHLYIFSGSTIPQSHYCVIESKVCSACSPIRDLSKQSAQVCMTLMHWSTNVIRCLVFWTSPRFARAGLASDTSMSTLSRSRARVRSFPRNPWVICLPSKSMSRITLLKASREGCRDFRWDWVGNS